MTPYNVLIVVADGTGARLFRNTGQGGSVSLSAAGEFKPSDLLDADKQTVGQIRPALHKEARNRLVREIGKTLTKASIADIEQALK